MQDAEASAKRQYQIGSYLELMAFVGILAVIAAGPLALSFGVHRIFSLPKSLIAYSLISVLLVLTLSGMVRSGKGGPTRPPLWFLGATAALLALLVPGVVSAIDPDTAFMGSYRQLSGAAATVAMIGLSVAVSMMRWTSERLRGLSFLLVAMAALLGCLGVLQYLIPEVSSLLGGAPGRRSVIGTLGNSSYFAAFLCFVIPVSLRAILLPEGAAERYAGVIAFLFAAVALVFTSSRSAWIGGAIAVIVLLALLRRELMARVNLRLALPAVAGLLLLGAVALLLPGGKGDGPAAISRVSTDLSSFGARLSYLQAAGKAVAERPLTGWGPDSFTFVYPRFAEESAAWPEPMMLVADHPHNLFADMAVDHGLPAALLFAALIVTAFVLLVRSRSRLPDAGSPALISAVIAGAAGLLIALQATPDSWGTMFLLWLVIGLAVGLHSMVFPREGAPPSALRAGSPLHFAATVALLGLVLVVSAGAAFTAFKYYAADSLFVDAIRSGRAQAEPYVERALELWPRNEFYLLSLAEIRKVSDPSGAERAARQAAESSPGSHVPYVFLSRFYMGEGSGLMGAGDSAVKAAREGLIRFPASAQLQRMERDAMARKAASD